MGLGGRDLAARRGAWPAALRAALVVRAAEPLPRRCTALPSPAGEAGARPRGSGRGAARGGGFGGESGAGRARSGEGAGRRGGEGRGGEAWACRGRAEACGRQGGARPRGGAGLRPAGEEREGRGAAAGGAGPGLSRAPPHTPSGGSVSHLGRERRGPAERGEGEWGGVPGGGLSAPCRWGRPRGARGRKKSGPEQRPRYC